MKIPQVVLLEGFFYILILLEKFYNISSLLLFSHQRIIGQKTTNNS